LTRSDIHYFRRGINREHGTHFSDVHGGGLVRCPDGLQGGKKAVLTRVVEGKKEARLVKLVREESTVRGIRKRLLEQLTLTISERGETTKTGDYDK